ncbi:MAG TPA: WbqC family protein [Williamwhitmania sp.]|nr:WbqC family protein [Williamwhitmania sp.]
MSSESTILSTAYFPPIQLFSRLVSNGRILIEQHEHYTKQSYRNRCTILSANGPLNLTIPVVKDSGNKMPIRDVEIDYCTPWQKVHWRAMESAYKSSPYFEHIADSLVPFFEKKTKYLFDLNLMLIESILDFLEITAHIETTSEYIPCYQETHLDLRGISPKSDANKIDSSYHDAPYYQVFSHKQPFVPNLSVVDLVFNEGLLSVDIMRRAIKKLA